MSITLGISPCPNDIYTYAGLLNKQIPNNYEIKVAQIGQLNRWAMNSELDIIKISAGTFPYVQGGFRLCKTGASFGFEQGPKLVFHRDRIPDDLNKITIATPSLTSTASFVVKQLFPKINQVQEDLIEIPKLVRDGKFIGGILINESMRNITKYHLHVKYDLAQYWYQKMNTPLPLGLVVISQHLSEDHKKIFEEKVKSSLEWSKDNHREAIQVTLEWSAEKNIAAVEAHIKTFTNHVSDSSIYNESVSRFLNSISPLTIM